ncbi:amidohydrolase family protein [Lawsonibacter faecis]|uniref:Amidohydrolase family protein n=1 Tax=Lawsonibacter faecis TaxID=2763052 RepID=A0A8J6MC11_9FIRM|nr:amidohydrolase family protein [Lawsonibacter faecis]MBC5735784.1 amidohydrolase family protein [Lawsonibacter faecis]
MKKVLITNCGPIMTGDIACPIASGEVIWAEDGVIRYIGAARTELIHTADEILDAKGLFVSPSMIDAHSHMPINDYLPQYKACDIVEDYMGGGITSMLSLGARMPGLPSTVDGSKALAILGKEMWENHRVRGARIQGGALMLVDGLEDHDFAQMAAAGVNMIAEVGHGPVKDIQQAARLTRMAKANGFIVPAHSGGPSSRDCAGYDADALFAIGPDVICHLNGGPTPMSDGDIFRVIRAGDFYYDLTADGNMRTLVNIVEECSSAGKLGRLMIGTNTPSAAGYSPMGIWMGLAAVCNGKRDLDPALCICMGTGNVADCYGLDYGKVKVGYRADLLFLQAAYPATDLNATLKAGDMPAIGCVMIDGQVVMDSCKNCPGPDRRPSYIRR